MYHKTTGLKWSTYDLYWYDQDAGNCLWNIGTVYYLTQSIGYPIKIDGGSNLLPTGYVYNGKEVYTTTISGTVYWVWHDLSSWIISQFLGYGTAEWYTAPTWYGDHWWSLAGTTITGTYLKRGTEKNSGSDKSVTAGQIEGRSSASIIGEFTPVAGSAVTGDVWVGWKILEDSVLDPAVEFIEGTELINGKEVYEGASRSIWWSSTLSKWIISATIGTADTLIGYWSCSTLLGTYNLTFTGGGDTPVPSTYTITAKEYRALSGTHDSYDIYMGQVAVWL